MPRTRTKQYQEGSFERVPRTHGPDVWVYRWRESDAAGRRVQRKRVIGTVSDLPTKSSAKHAVENLRAEINAPEEKVLGLTLRELWGHFQAHELRDPDVDRSPTTIDLYLTNFRRHILPRWGDARLSEVKAVEVEKWLRGMPEAPATKSKLRNQLSAIFAHAIRHELWEKANPIATVRQSAKRLKEPTLLSLPEMRAILSNLDRLMHRTIVLVAAVTGFRLSEIRGLKWSDIDFENLWIRPKRGVVRKHRTKLKTAASRRGIPIPIELGLALRNWRETALYRADHDWVFASEQKNGTVPVWLDTILKKHVRPAARRAGIHTEFGWHTFRHSLATLLARKKEDVKVVQELLRHANVATTLNLYQQADRDDKRAAQTHTIELFRLAS